MIERLTCLLLGLACGFVAAGQTDSTLSVTGSTVTVVEWKQPASQLGNQNLATTLPAVGVYVKNYGPGSVATLSLRGGSAGQTLVLWNGLPLGNPSLGLLDLSTLPIAGLDYLRVERGGASADYGSGAVTGVIRLEDGGQAGQRSRVNILSEVGSFGHFHQQVEAKFSPDSGAWRGFVTADFTEAENDFTFNDRRLTHAYFRNRNVKQGLTFTPSEAHRFQFRYWYGDTERQIPPTSVQRRSEAVQEDRHHRLFLEHEARSPNQKQSVETKVGHFRERLDYLDPLSGVDSPSEFVRTMAESRLRWKLPNFRHVFLLGATLNHTKATVTEAYPDGRSETRRALLAGYRYNGERWGMDGLVRQEWIADGRAPLVPSLDLSYRLSKDILLSARASRDYRYPTLNDRFWPLGGDTDLLPEVGWSQEVGAEHIKDYTGGYLRSAIRVFHRTTDQFIQWVPPEAGFFWSVRNLDVVSAHGAEVALDWSAYFGLSVAINYNYTRSEFRGKQLLYTPVHQGAGRLKFTRRNWDAYVNQRYGGATRGVNVDPEAYWLTDLGASYSRKFGPVPIRLFFHLNNLFGSDYRIIERRPLPGRHFRLGVSLGFHPPKH